MCFSMSATGYASEPSLDTEDGILALRVQTNRFDKRVVVHFSDGSACACSLLHDDADWNEPIWKLRDEVLPKLLKALTLLHNKFEGGFNFEAWWVSDRIKHQPKVSLDELLELIHENRLGNFTRYIVQ